MDHPHQDPLLTVLLVAPCDREKQSWTLNEASWLACAARPLLKEAAREGWTVWRPVKQEKLDGLQSLHLLCFLKHQAASVPAQAGLGLQAS